MLSLVQLVVLLPSFIQPLQAQHILAAPRTRLPRVLELPTPVECLELTWPHQLGFSFPKIILVAQMSVHQQHGMALRSVPWVLKVEHMSIHGLETVSLSSSQVQVGASPHSL